MLSKQEVTHTNPVARTDGENALQRAWRLLSPWPGGKFLFSKLIGWLAPYTGTVKAQVVELRKGYCKVQMRDRRSVRNHLHSIHAIALLNLAEIASGVGMIYSMPPGARGILAGFSIEYLKKGRGLLTAESECAPPLTNERQEFLVKATIKNEAGEIVAVAQAKWLVGPEKK